ncbi:hypothetical protein SALBM311S_12677 [Streptomyces alboniger]
MSCASARSRSASRVSASVRIRSASSAAALVVFCASSWALVRTSSAVLAALDSWVALSSAVRVQA